MTKKLILILSLIILISIVAGGLILNSDKIIPSTENSAKSFRESFSDIINEKMINGNYWEVIEDINYCETKSRNKDGTEGQKNLGQPETQTICSDYEGKVLNFDNVQIILEGDSY